jgi:protein TonB
MRLSPCLGPILARLALPCSVGLCSLACPWSVLDPELPRCAHMEYQNREAVGLRGHVAAGMSEQALRDAFAAHAATGSRLEGPIPAGARLFGGPPAGIAFAHAYLVVDRTGCPLWRFFFDEQGRLAEADSLYHEFGSYFFSPSLAFLTRPEPAPYVSMLGCTATAEPYLTNAGESPVSPPRAVKKEKPRPPSKGWKKILGVEVLVTRTGEVAEARVRDPVAPEVDAAYVEAVKRWRFQPATRDGSPVAACHTLTFVVP